MLHKFKKVLVTGGAGCIGIQVCHELADRRVACVLFDLPEQIGRTVAKTSLVGNSYYGSILDRSSLRDAMSGCDAIIHLGAYLGVRRTELNPLRCIEINIEGTKNVLECAIQNRIRKLVFASSSEVYGEPLDNPVNEKTITQGKTVYAVTKLAGEEMCKAFAQRYPEFSYTILRFFNTYGPNQIAQFVVPKFIKNVLADKSPIIYGDGSQIRSYCYASDTARATVDALVSKKASSEILNVGNSTEPVTLSELANLIIEVAGKQSFLKPVYKPNFRDTDRTKDREVFTRHCDIAKIRSVLGFKPEVKLRDGIARVIEHGHIFSTWESTDIQYSLDE